MLTTLRLLIAAAVAIAATGCAHYSRQYYSPGYDYDDYPGYNNGYGVVEQNYYNNYSTPQTIYRPYPQPHYRPGADPHYGQNNAYPQHHHHRHDEQDRRHQYENGSYYNRNNQGANPGYNRQEWQQQRRDNNAAAQWQQRQERREQRQQERRQFADGNVNRRLNRQNQNGGPNAANRRRGGHLNQE